MVKMQRSKDVKVHIYMLKYIERREARALKSRMKIIRRRGSNSKRVTVQLSGKLERIDRTRMPRTSKQTALHRLMRQGDKRTASSVDATDIMLVDES